MAIFLTSFRKFFAKLFFKKAEIASFASPINQNLNFKLNLLYLLYHTKAQKTISETKIYLWQKILKKVDFFTKFY